MDSRSAELEQESKQRIEELAHAYAHSDCRRKNRLSSHAEQVVVTKPFDFTYYLKYGTHSFFRQFSILLRRNIREGTRDKMSTLSRLVQSLVMALFCGLLYFRLGDDQQSIMDRRGALFYIAIQQALCGFLSIIAVFHNEKMVYYREHDSKMYNTLAYYIGMCSFHPWSASVVGWAVVWCVDSSHRLMLLGEIAKWISELPMSILSPIIFLGIAYPMVELQADPIIFLEAMGCLVLSTLAAQASGMVVGTLSPSYDLANIIAPVIMGFMVIFGGLLISDDSVPVYMRWIPAVNFVKYSFQSECHAVVISSGRW